MEYVWFNVTFCLYHIWNDDLNFYFFFFLLETFAPFHFCVCVLTIKKKLNFLVLDINFLYKEP